MIYERGFTLIELLIVVAIISITMSIGLPSYNSIVASSRLTSTANAMVSALQLARMEALKKHKTVIVRPKGGTTDNWVNGWEVFVDDDGDNVQGTATEEATITTFDALSSTVKVVSTYTGASTDTISYNPSGRAKAGHFTFCSPATGTATDFRKVVIAATGRVHVETPTSCS